MKKACLLIELFALRYPSNWNVPTQVN